MLIVPQIRELYPFERETIDEWCKPIGVNLVKPKIFVNEWKSTDAIGRDVFLENLLPPRSDTDILISFYLEHLEQLHRIVHVPTFQREYDNFWKAERTRHPAMTVLILAIISVSTSICPRSADAASILIKYRIMPAQWISACDEWLRQQSPKHRKLVHYQIACLLYLAKRINMFKKKRWWKETCSLVQDAIIDGLQYDNPLSDSPYMREMKRRIWAVLRELDLQNSFEYGLPTLLYNIGSEVPPPTNIDDIDFDENSKEPPRPKSVNKYTSMSYQVVSARSWSVRLEISQRLFSTTSPTPIPYDDVMRYTHTITQLLDSIPCWQAENMTGSPGIPMVAYAFLQFQLKECILLLHRPYLQHPEGKFWLSESVCYHSSRDILLLNIKLADSELQSLTALREDLLLSALTLTRITILQPPG